LTAGLPLEKLSLEGKQTPAELVRRRVCLTDAALRVLART